MQSTVTTVSVGEFVHVCIDDASRIAFVQVLVDQRKIAVAFLEAAVGYFDIDDAGDDGQRLVLPFKDVPAACKRFGLRQIFTRPYTPQPTERPNASFRRHCANGPTLAPPATSDQRSAELLYWLHRYNSAWATW